MVTDANNNAPSSPKPDRLDEANIEIEKRLEKVITRLGETPTNQQEQHLSLQQHIQQLTKHLDELSQILELDLEDHKDFILRILTLCSYQLPQKCCIYTTLVGLINSKNYPIGNEFLELLVQELNMLLRQERWDESRYVIRFICDLVNANVVSHASVILFLETLLDVVQEEGIPLVRKDWYAFAILSALPWCGKELFDRPESKPHLDEIVMCVEQYIKSQERRNHAKMVKDILSIWKNDSPHPQEEFLSLFLEQIHSMRNNSWQERFLIRPYLSFKKEIAENLVHDIPAFEPPVHSASAQYPLPKVTFRMFDLSDITECENQNLPPPKTIERFIIEEQIVQTLDIYKLDKKMVAERLLNMAGANRIPIQAMVCEVLFGQMLMLPKSQDSHYIAMFTCIFIELCKLQSMHIPPVISNACETIYSRLDSMSIKSREKFEEWFAHHLSNFQFLWGWDNWTGDNLNEKLFNSQKVIFVKEIFENCLKLSYYSKMADIVPDDILHLIPKEPICRFKFKRRVPVISKSQRNTNNSDDDQNSDSEMNDNSQEKSNKDREVDPLDLDDFLASRRDWAKKLVNEYLKQKKNSQEIISFLNDIERSGLGPEGKVLEEGCHWEAIDVFVTTILEYRKRSMSHSTSALNTYLPVFLHLAKTDSGKSYILWTLFEVWRDHKQMIIVVIDRMLSVCVLTPSSVIEWALNFELSDELSRSWLWRVIANTIKKMNKHVIKIDYELCDIRDRAEEGNNIDNFENDLLKTYNAFTPDEAEIQKVERKLEASKEQQKRLYLQSLQKIVNLIGTQADKCNKMKNSGDENSYEFKNSMLLLNIFLERLSEFLLQYHDNIGEHMTAVSRLVFDDADDMSKVIFSRFQQLSA